jgi:hypothetical protein
MLLVPFFANMAVSARDAYGAGYLLLWFYPFFCFEAILVPFLAIGQFVPQIVLVRRSSDCTRPSVYLLSILAVDSVLYTCLGAAYMALLLRCTWDPDFFSIFYLFGHVFLIIALVGNYAIVGVGHIVLLVLYARKVPVARDTEPTDVPAEGCEQPEGAAIGETENEPLLAGLQNRQSYGS